jgi:heavy metal sensor kinase
LDIRSGDEGFVNIRSLRFKLSWFHGLSIAVIITVFGLVRYQVLSYSARRDFDEHLLVDAQVFAGHCRVSSDTIAWNHEGLDASTTLSVLEMSLYFVLTDPAGQIYHKDLHSKYVQELLSQGTLEPVLRQHAGFSDAMAADGSAYRFVNLPVRAADGSGLFYLHIGRVLDPLANALQEYLSIYLYSAPLILMFSVAVGWYLSGRALRPFQEVAQTAERISSINLHTRIATAHQEIEVVRLVKAFNAMIGRLHESFQQMRKFNADAAHELRTPLAILQGETEIALRTPALPEDIRSVLISNLEELDRLTRIINDMLTLAEAEAGNQVLVKTPLNLKPLLEDLVDQMRVLALDRNISIDLFNLHDATVDVDELWIRRAFLNLVDNAIKYSKDEASIQVRLLAQGEQARLSIRDEGIGIGAEDLPHIFDRLFRADPARSRASGGAGLGLSLVKWIVEEHGGRIEVQSELGRGTTFEVVLPLSEYGRRIAAQNQNAIAAG